jgi:hypothetical protein
MLFWFKLLIGILVLVLGSMVGVMAEGFGWI